MTPDPMQKKGAMSLRQKPVQRAIATVLQLGDREYRGTFFAHDFGGSSHFIEGIFLDASGKQHRLRGQLSGFEFEPAQKGRPKGDKAPLDVGLMLCHYWLEHAARRSLERANVRSEVLEWWQAKGWPGASDAQALNKRICDGKKIIKGMSLQRFEPDDPSAVSTLIALPSDAVKFEMAGTTLRATTDGKGWFWQSGRARAEFGRLRYAFAIENPSQAAVAFLLGCQGR